MELRQPHQTPPLPLSFGELGMLFLDQHDSNHNAYNVLVAQRLRGVLDADTLNVALSKLAARHEILRTGFVMDDAPQRIVVPNVSISIERVDLRDLSEDEKARHWPQNLSDWSLQRIPLSEPPLLRVKAWRLVALRWKR